MSTTEKKAIKLIALQLGFPEEKIKPESRFVEDLECDSLYTIEIVMELEYEFDIEMADERLEQFKTVRELTEYVEELLKQPVSV